MTDLECAELKLACLEIALKFWCDQPVPKIVEQAQAYYDFVTRR